MAITISNYNSLLAVSDSTNADRTFTCPKYQTWIEKRIQGNNKGFIFKRSDGASQLIRNWEEITPPLSSTYEGTYQEILAFIFPTSQSTLKKITSSIILPNTGPTYSDGNVFGSNPASNFVFNDVSILNGGSGFIVGAEVLLTDVTGAADAVTTTLRLWSLPPTPLADNVAWTRGNKIEGYEGKVNIDGFQVSGSKFSLAEAIMPREKFICASNSKNLYGQLEVSSPYIRPVDNHDLVVSVYVEQF